MISSLTADQRTCFDLVRSKRNVFITGKAGTGKSYLIETIINWLADQEISYALLASTGISACHIGGVTMHSYFRLPPAILSNPEDYQPHINVRAVRRTEVLIIDEISMVPPEILDGLELAFRREGDGFSPWGGTQVIFLGDFFQLPPIYPKGMDDRFAFQADSWESLVPFQLTEVVRQAGDPEFAEVLNSIRIGQLHRSPRKLRILESCVCEPEGPL